VLKQFIVGAAAIAAGVVPFAGMASAAPFPGAGDDGDQVGVANLNNLDVIHNLNATVGICDNNLNVIGVQVPVEDVANGLGVQALASGENGVTSALPESCAATQNTDGGTFQAN